MLDKVFDIDYYRLLDLVIPPILRKTKMTAWLQCLVIPIKMLHGTFKTNRLENIYTLSHGSQVCYLRKVLNDTFDPYERRIKVNDGNRYPRQYIYTQGEEQPVFLGTMYLRQSSDYADTGVDFRVVVPVGFDLAPNIHRLKAMIDFYKLASKRYKIEYDEQN